MCVISLYCKNSKDLPELKDLKQMEKTHNHGGGLAWIQNGFVHYRKGINLNSKEIMKLIKKNKIKPPFVIHFRIKSSGVICSSKSCDFKNPKLKHDCSCHGFVLDDLGINDQSGKTKQGIMFHNGTINEDLLNIDIKQICLTKNIRLPKFVSDSHKVAFLVAHYGDRYILDFIENSEKFAILKPSGLTYYNNFETDSNNNLVSNTWHDDTYDYSIFKGSRYTMYNSKDCNNADCLSHDDLTEECLILENGRHYKIDKKGNYRELDPYDDEYGDLMYDDYIFNDRRINEID